VGIWEQGGATVGLVMAYDFERKIWKKIREVIRKGSKNQPTTEDIDNYSTYHWVIVIFHDMTREEQ